MDKYECVACGYIYDPKEHKDIKFSTLPDTFNCPNCGAEKECLKKFVCKTKKINHLIYIIKVNIK